MLDLVKEDNTTHRLTCGKLRYCVMTTENNPDRSRETVDEILEVGIGGVNTNQCGICRV